MQLYGAISGNAKKANEAADVVMVGTSIAGSATFIASKGDMDLATTAVAVEGLASASFMRTLFESPDKIVDAALNIHALFTAPKPPSPPTPRPPKKDDNEDNSI